MAERDLGNLCGAVLELTMVGHVAAYVCDRDRHSNGSHAAHTGDGSAVRWLSIDARAPLPIAVTERPSHLYSCPARVRDGVPCGCAMVAESVPPIDEARL